MSIHVVKAGLQTSIQAAPRTGLRHWAIPSGGAADPLSLALANRLVGNPAARAGLEISLSGAVFEAGEPLVVAVTGAESAVAVNDTEAGMHQTLRLNPGDHLDIGPARTGARAYLAVAGQLDIPSVLGSESTCIAAGFGGLEGRSLKDGDELGVTARQPGEDLTTPDAYRYVPTSAALLRAVPASGTDSDALFDVKLDVAARADRMGVQLSSIGGAAAGGLPSQPVFPGSIQLPPDGHPFILGVDAQATGGYAVLAHVARVDRHLLGQLRPGQSLSFTRCDPRSVRRELTQKIHHFAHWIPDVADAVV